MTSGERKFTIPGHSPLERIRRPYASFPHLSSYVASGRRFDLNGERLSAHNVFSPEIHMDFGAEVRLFYATGTVGARLARP
jgi:hypothetical protein